MTPIRSGIPESTDNRPRDLYRCGSLGMFLVSLLYERKCLRIDLIKINCSLNVPFIFWFLYVLNSVTSELQCGSCRVFIVLAKRMAYYYRARLAGILSKMFYLIRHCVFWSPVRGNLQVFLSLYRANRVISNVYLQNIFVCGSETGLQAWEPKETRR